jgi:hypothetical protein
LQNAVPELTGSTAISPNDRLRLQSRQGQIRSPCRTLNAGALGKVPKANILSLATLLSGVELRTMSDNDDLDSSESAFDRPSVGRTKIVKGAPLFFRKKAGVQSCTVRDITNLGAGIRAQNLPIMPLDFELPSDGFRTGRKCRLIRRRDEFFGAAFGS